MTHSESRRPKLFGYARADLLGQTIEMLVPARFRGRHPAHREGYFNTPNVRPMGSGLDLCGLRKNGTEFPIEISLSPQETEDGTLVSSAIRDITLRERAKEEQSRLAAIIDSATDAIIGKDLNGRIQSWNPSAERLFGYTHAEAVGRPIAVLIPPEHQDEEERIMARIRHGERVEPYESQRLHKNGTLIDVWLTVSPVRDAQGKVVGASKIVADMTQRKRAEKQFRHMLESAPNAIVIVGSSGRIVLVNSQTEKLFGYARDELLGKTVEILVPTRFRGVHPSHRDGYFENPHVRPMGNGLELFGLRRDSTEFPIEISLSPMELEDGSPASHAIIRDVTERKQAERLVLDSLHEKEVLLKEIHHRVKNNRAVISSLFFLQSKTVPDERLVRILEESQDRVRSMAMVHESLYNSENLSQVDFADYAVELSSRLVASYSLGPDQIRLTTEVEPVQLNIDVAVPCGLILNEIVTNAVKHAFPGGRSGVIHLVLRCIGEDRCELVVRDDGVGLPPGFDPAGGASLGVRLIRSLSRQVDGVFEFRPGVGGGTDASLTLPLVRKGEVIDG
ncbi:MAG TPA: PAS domain S-box protein [Accumulibacter sp.]|uniref:PAS domain S-box protein n=1 Tax=Accumulibacter sp. TaxID=2053492 RepID=UPI002BFEE256|nr:PAS domain S-box protein [Accumulibacter sp.]HRD90416.1 PAS domain S-box protein [Accumulibacter sp.]